MNKNKLLGVILITALLLTLGLGAFIDAAAAELEVNNPTLKPTTKATDTPPPKLTSTPTVKPTNTPTDTPTSTPTPKPPPKVTNTAVIK